MYYKTLLSVIIYTLIFNNFIQASDNDFFPFDQGRTWEYDVTSEGDPGNNFKVTVASLPSIKTERGEILVIAGHRWLSKNKEKTFYEYYLNDAKGLQLINMSDTFIAYPIPTVMQPQYIVYFPIKVGSFSTWEIRDDFYENMVESLNETVTVPAGTFKDCVKIKRDIRNKKAGGLQSTTQWYARNVGRVKSIQTIHGKKIIHNLVSYDYDKK